jgi:shikimate dehydrogenase
VINATSASLAGELPPLPPDVFAPAALAYDMVYGNEATRFLAYARDNGAAQVADGLGMLLAQAAESFLLWRGVRPDTGPLFEMLRGG